MIDIQPDFDNLKRTEKLKFGIPDKAGKATQIFDFGGFKPFWYQALILKELFKRPKLLRCFLCLPRRAGKTFLMVILAIWKLLEKVSKGTDQHTLQIGLVYPEMAAGKLVAWDEIKNRTEGLPNRKINSQMGYVEWKLPSKNSEGKEHEVTCRIRIVGLKNQEAKRGGGYDGLILDEKGSLPSSANKVIMPMISDKVKQPTFLYNIGTPNEEGDFWETYDKYKEIEEKQPEKYFTFKTNYDKLKHISVEAYEDQKLEMSPEAMDIEYGCKRGVVTGARYYSEEFKKAEKDGRIKKLVEIESQMKVMACDVGSTAKDLFAIWICQFNYGTGLLELIDYEEIISANEDKIFNYAQSSGYNIGQIILPWDAATGLKPVQQTMREMFPAADVQVMARDGKNAKINRIRKSRLLFNKVCFDEKACAVGINHLRRFSKKWNAEKMIYTIDPKHDAHSHGADAFGHLAHADSQKILVFDNDRDIYGGGNEILVAKTYDPIDTYLKGDQYA